MRSKRLGRHTRRLRGQRTLMSFNLFALVFCWGVAVVNLFYFKDCPLWTRIATFMMAFGGGCMNIPFVIEMW